MAFIDFIDWEDPHADGDEGEGDCICGACGALYWSNEIHDCQHNREDEEEERELWEREL